MIRQSSSRNQRSKGVRGKHILQICMLLAVCFWLIYQVKHSHDKRKHFEENDVDVSEKLPKFDEVVKLGRKDLHPRDEDLSTTHDRIDDDEVEDEESGGKGDESFDETQEELERKRKEEGAADIEALIKGGHIEEEDEGGRVGDDEIDEQDKGDEDVIEGLKDAEKDEENETEEKDNDDDDEHQQENDSSSDDQDHDRNTHETREENYKADDASSAVAHIVQTKLHERPEHRNLNAELDVQEHEETSNGTDVGKEQYLNTTNVLENSDEATPPRLEDVLIKNDTNEASSETIDSTPQSEGGQVLETTTELRNSTEDLTDDKSSNITTSYSINATEEDRPISTSNTTDATREHDDNSNSTMNQGFSAPDLVINSNLTTHSNQTDSSTTDDNEDVFEEKTDSEEDSILSTLNDDETLRDPLISEEEDNQRDNLLDLDTLPEIRTEGTDSDDAASE